MDERLRDQAVSTKPQSKKWKFVLNRLIDLPWLVKGAMFIDMGASIAFHVIKILVMYDLHNVNYHPDQRKDLLILRNEYYGATKSHFWALCGVACEQNLHTTSVVIWGILAYGILHADASWVRAWCMLRKVILFTMIIPNLTIAFGGAETHFTLVNTIVFFLYYLEAVLAIEVVSRYYVTAVKTASTPVLKTD